MNASKTMKGLPITETHELSADSLFYKLKPEYAIPYRESIDVQLRNWLNGNPTHNEYSDECCPDFSCCHPEMIWPKSQREAFMTADQDGRESMLVMGLASVVGKGTVYIAGQTNPNKTSH